MTGIGRLAAKAKAVLYAEGAEALAAALSFAAPVALGVATGHVGAGLAGATGALMSGGGSREEGQAGPRNASTILLVLAAPLLATFLAQSIGGLGSATGALVTGLVFFASLIGGFSRPMAMATTRFSVFLLITLNVASGTGNGKGAMLMIGAGMLWSALLSRVARRLTPARARPEQEPSEPVKAPAPFDRRVAYFMRGLQTPGGWAFALRVGLALAIAEAAAVVWPDQHLHWIALTVVLLSARKPEPGQGKIRERALGTAIGVGIAGLLLLWRPSPWELVAGVALIAGARPFLMTRSYMAYSVAMTPLIMLLQDFTTPPHIGLLADRLGATLAGALLVMAGARLFPPREPQPTRQPGARHERPRPAAEPSADRDPAVQ
ncbi:MAG: hypothetical protein JWP35_4601 [Caulobacter sp.]|nr:hypothetical protein [Caulobacter sp.]